MCYSSKKGEVLMGVRNMQGVAAHLETLRSLDGKRRDKRKCIFYYKPEKMCHCPKSPYNRQHCPSPSHCKFYREKKK